MISNSRPQQEDWIYSSQAAVGKRVVEIRNSRGLRRYFWNRKQGALTLDFIHQIELREWEAGLGVYSKDQLLVGPFLLDSPTSFELMGVQWEIVVSGAKEIGGVNRLAVHSKKLGARLESTLIFGVGPHVLGMEILGTSRHCAWHKGRKIFSVYAKDGRVIVEPKQETCVRHTELSIDRVAAPVEICRLGKRGEYWWKIGTSTRPLELLQCAAPAGDIDNEDRQFLKRSSLTVSLGFLIFFIALVVPEKLKTPREMRMVEPPKALELKLPKVRKSERREKIATPVEVAQPIKTAVIVEKPAPKKLEKKLVAKPAPKPVQVAKKEPKKPVVSDAKALAKARLMKSLGFLSSASKKVMAEGKVKASADASGLLAASVSKNTKAGIVNTASKLDNLAAAHRENDGTITSTNARDINANLNHFQVVAAGSGPVLARVDTRQANRGGGNIGASLGSASNLKVEGDGDVEESAVVAELMKNLRKFQYCYEKALLTDSSLAGSVQMKWSIGSEGRTTGVSVVRSDLSHGGLHQCLSREIEKIQFPSPSGGAVSVSFPFTFTSSTI